MDRYPQFGLRGEADEQLRRAFRDGFKRAGLSPEQLQHALQWYADRGRHLGGDEAKLRESFAEFAASKGWAAPQLEAAVSLYDQVRDQGPEAVTSPVPAAEEDAATIARAQELLRSDPQKYWRDHELQEAQLEALERREAARLPDPIALPKPAPVPDAGAADASGAAAVPDRSVDQVRHDAIVAMMRDPERSRDYWRSETMQQEFRDVLGRLGGGAAAGGGSPPSASADPGQAAASGPADGGAVRA